MAANCREVKSFKNLWHELEMYARAMLTLLLYDMSEASAGHAYIKHSKLLFRGLHSWEGSLTGGFG